MSRDRQRPRWHWTVRWAAHDGDSTRQTESGMVTAELAVTMPAVALVLLLVQWGVRPGGAPRAQ